MGRRAIQPGEHGAITFRGRHPDTGKWVAADKLRAEGVKPTAWQARTRWCDPHSRQVRVVTNEGTAKARAESALRATLAGLEGSSRIDAHLASESVGEGLLRLRERIEDGVLGLAPRTVTQYLNVLDHRLVSAESLLAERQLRDVTPLDVKEELLRIRTRSGESTMRHARAMLSRVFEEAVDARAIEQNPVLSVTRMPKERKRPRVYANGAPRTKNRALSADEEERLVAFLDSQPEHVASLILLCLDEGLRITEATSLRWQDIDFDHGEIRVRGKLVRIKGEGLVWDPFTKDLRERTLPMRPRARAALERRHAALLERGDGRQYVFTTPRGGKPDPDNYNTLVRKALDAAGLEDCTIHTLRRTVERDLERAGTTVAEREQWLGHTEAIARRHYADHSQPLSRAAELLQSVQ